MRCQRPNLLPAVLPLGCCAGSCWRCWSCCRHRCCTTAAPKPCAPPTLQARLVRAALEGALQQLKAQCPSVISSRRERSLGRALPLLGKALAGGWGGERQEGQAPARYD